MSESTEERLTRIETKLDVIIQRLPDHETRIRSLEKWKYSLPPTFILALISLITSLIVAVLST